MKEFHEEVELFLPLLVTAHDVEVVQLTRYTPLDVAHDALKRRPDEERKALSEYLRSSHGKSGVGHQAVKRFALETAQLMLAVEVARRSRQLLGDEAELDGILYVHGSPISDVESFPPEPGDDDERLLGGVRDRIVVFGHSHAPLLEASEGGPLLVNPGSPTQRRRQPVHTVAWLEVADGEVRGAQVVKVGPLAR